MISDLSVGYYRHFKGNIYQVFGTVSNPENLLTYALYGKISPSWIRVMENFTSPVWLRGKGSVPRFNFLGKEIKSELEIARSTTDAIEPITRGYYRHFKGEICHVFGAVKNSESLLTYVLYGQSAPKLVRAIEIFMAPAWNGSALVPRYEFLGEQLQESLL